MPLVLFNPKIGPRRTRVDLGAMAMKRCSVFPQIPRTLPSDCLVLYLGQSLVGYLSAKVESVYSTAPAEWATVVLSKRKENV